MKRKMGLAVAAMLCLTGFNMGANQVPWMSGHWLSQDGAAWSEESWLDRGHFAVGVGATGTGELLRNYEFMRIENDSDGKLTFWSSPGGRPPVEFKMVLIGANQVVFENPKHDYPTRISYRREGKLLIATISGPAGSRPQTWRYRKVRG